MEDDEHRDDEQQHRGQRVARSQLEQEILARERAHIGEVAHAASARRSVANGSRRAGSCVEASTVCAAQLCELGVEQLRALCVERRVRLVEHEERRLVQQHAAEREPLRHAARVRGDALAARLPEAEALEQHPDSLATLGDAVEAAVEVEVLERRELAVDQRVVPEEAEPGARDADLQLSLGRQGEAGADAQQRRLPRAVGAGDDGEAAVREVEIDAAQDTLLAEALTELAGVNHPASVGPFYTGLTQTEPESGVPGVYSVGDTPVSRLGSAPCPIRQPGGWSQCSGHGTSQRSRSRWRR